MYSKRPHQHAPHKVTKPNKWMQRQLQKHTACFCYDYVYCHCFLSAQCQSPTMKTRTLGCRQSQFKLRLRKATHRCLLELILARWCLCTAVAPIICQALSCQPSCDIASCYMDVFSGPECRCWQTRIGGCWRKRLVVCVFVCEWYSRHGWMSLFSQSLSCPSLSIWKNVQITHSIFPKRSCN